MQKFNKEMVDDLANKLLIGLTLEENKMVLAEFAAIDAQIDLINELEGINEVEPMMHTLDDFEFNLREDISEDSIKIEDALRNAGQVEGREIEVPKIVGE